MKNIWIVLSLLLFCASSGVNSALAEWKQGLGYKVRLIEGKDTPEGQRMVGLDIVLEEGWKTYWRFPGGNGIPPVFDFGGSVNLDTSEIEWPAPRLFDDGESTGIGYKNRVVLPFRLTPFFSGEPLDVQLSAYFGVCSEICVPAQETFSLKLDPASRNLQDAALLEQSRETIPRPADATATRIVSSVLKSVEGEDYVLVSLKGGETSADSTDDGKRYLVIEGPSDWYFVPQTLVANGDPNSIQTVSVPLYRSDQSPIKSPVSLRVTLIDPAGSMEKTMPLELAGGS